MGQQRLFNQKQAAAYLTGLGLRTDPSELSLMGKYGAGPRFQRVGTTKIFTAQDLDEWLAAELNNNPPDTQEDIDRDHGKPVGGL